MNAGTPSGTTAVAAEQANVTPPMTDQAMTNGGMSTDFTFKLETIGAATNSDGMDITKVDDNFLRADGPDKQPGSRKSEMPGG